VVPKNEEQNDRRVNTRENNESRASEDDCKLRTGDRVFVSISSIL